MLIFLIPVLNVGAKIAPLLIGVAQPSRRSTVAPTVADARLSHVPRLSELVPAPPSISLIPALPDPETLKMSFSSPPVNFETALKKPIGAIALVPPEVRLLKT